MNGFLIPTIPPNHKKTDEVIGHNWLSNQVDVALEATDKKQPLHPSTMSPAYGWISHPLISELKQQRRNDERTLTLDKIEQDISTLAATKLPSDLGKRLRDAHDCSKAAYELSIAAGFSRLGYPLVWCPAIDEPHPEFLVTTGTSGLLAVECKKRDAGDGYEKEAGRFWKHLQYPLRKKMQADSLNYWVKVLGREFLLKDIEHLSDEIITAIKAGRMPSGRRARLYGYTYLSGKGTGEGVRYINEPTAKWVKQIFHWFVNEGLGIDRITYKLRELGIPTPSGKGLWYASEVWKILRNRAYIGETYVFTQTYGEPKTRLSKGTKSKKTGLIRKPREEWIEIPGATPPIIDRDLFETAQAQLKRNKDRASRNTKQQYLLSGYIRCRRCNRNYWGYVKRAKWGGDYHAKRYYRCSGNLQMVSPVRCGNRNLPADKVEALIWQEVEKLLSHPDLVLAELERKRAEVNNKGFHEEELGQVNRRLKALDREQDQLLQWALKGFPEETVIRENEKFNWQRAELKERRAELETRIDQAKQAEVDIAGIERFCELVQQNLRDFTFEDKRLALEALQTEVWVDGETITVLGSIPVIEGDIVSTRRWWGR